MRRHPRQALWPTVAWPTLARVNGVRFGLLGAAKIAPNALIRPANAIPRAAVVAMAARDRHRAVEFATKHAIPAVHDSYEALLADPTVDAVYNPLPNGLHGRWTIAALEAGKHVLCEKPFTANAVEAQLVADATDASGLVVMEAFHWRYHPMATRMLEVLASGEIGEVRRAHASICFPLTSRSDIRWQLDLAGGALMDAGCYAIHMLRHLLGGEPRVVAATAKQRFPEVDRLTEARLEFPGGVDATIRASLWSRHVLVLAVQIDGTGGSLRAINPLAPHYLSWLRIKGANGSRRERPPRSSTYLHQLEAFCAAILDGASFPTTANDAVANMTVIDAIYLAAGLSPRVPTDP